jgi:uncharacterized membrane protein (DUF106 family)
MNRYSVRFPQANKEYKEAQRKGDVEEMERLDTGFDSWVDSEIERMKERRYEK